MRFALMAGLVTILTAVADVEALETQVSRAPRWYLDGTLVGAQPTGEFGLNVDEGWASSSEDVMSWIPPGF